MYEVLDVLSMYVFGRKPDHKNEEHTIYFNLNDEIVKDDSYQDAIKKIQEVNFFIHFLLLFIVIYSF